MINPNLDGVIKTLEKYIYPVDIIVEVTRHCNLRCIMCPYPYLERSQGNMEYSTFKKIVDETVVENPMARIWLGIMGEPLMVQDDIVYFIHYAKEQGVKEICLNTNAVLMSPLISKKIVVSGLDKVIVSLDAFSQSTYDKIRVGGDYDKVMKNVEAFLELKKIYQNSPEIIIQFIVMDENEHELEAFKEHWLSKGAIVKIRPKLGWGNAIQSSVLEDFAKNTDRFPCAWLTRTVSIHWDGSFSQCDADHEGLYSPGHLNHNTIKEVWEGVLAERRSRHWCSDFNFKPCDTCKDWLAGRSYFYYPEGGMK